MKLNIVKAVSIAGLLFISQLTQAAPPTVDEFDVGQPLTAEQMNNIKALLEYNTSRISDISSGPTTTVYAGAPSAENAIYAVGSVVGSVWIDISGGEAYILTDDALGAEVWKSISNNAPTVYAIGDSGPAGGIVFYITDGGLHGLEAATANQEPTQWGCRGTEISGANGTAVGTGEQNTADIIAGCNETTAASVASAYGPGWYLPSKDELNLLYVQKEFGVVGGFASSNYWSSSQANSGFAWRQSFGSGLQYDNYSKGSTLRVRAVRAF
jgi:hypothetical protein